jgi:hypothetical protein
VDTVPPPRDLASGEDGNFIGLRAEGERENNVAASDEEGTPLASRFITDDAAGLLDLASASNGNLDVSGEFPFRARDAITRHRRVSSL